MSNSRDKDDGPGHPPPYWQDWFRQFMSAAEAASPAGGLDATWRAAVDGWWDGVEASIPPEGRELLEPAVDQGKA
jgi:hypothetical protein